MVLYPLVTACIKGQNNDCPADVLAPQVARFDQQTQRAPFNTHKECLCSVDGGTADKVYSSTRRIAVIVVRLGGGATQMKVEGGLMKQRVGTWLLVLASHWLATRQECPLSHKRAIHVPACRNAMPSFGFALSSLRHAFAVAERRSLLRDPKDRRSSSKSHCE